MGKPNQNEIKPPPLTRDEESQLTAFRKLRRKFHKKWEEKLGQHDSAGQFDETPDDWLARTAYRHLRRIVVEDRWPMLEYLASYDRSLKKGRHPIQGLPFKVGLIAILGDKIKLTRNRRAELSDAMEYAYIHRVHFKHFNGFVKQAGQKRIASKLKENHVEPGFRRDDMRPLPRNRPPGFPLIT